MDEERVANRSIFRYVIGLIIRVIIYLKYECFRLIAIMRGASIGENTNISFKLAVKANSNLLVGSNTII